MKERMETLEEKVARVVKEDVAVVPYDPRTYDREGQSILRKGPTRRRRICLASSAILNGDVRHAEIDPREAIR
jgi:hypothetical protein